MCMCDRRRKKPFCEKCESKFFEGVRTTADFFFELKDNIIVIDLDGSEIDIDTEVDDFNFVDAVESLIEELENEIEEKLEKHKDKSVVKRAIAEFGNLKLLDQPVRTIYFNEKYTQEVFEANCFECVEEGKYIFKTLIGVIRVEFTDSDEIEEYMIT